MSAMKRRDFMALLGGAAVWPLRAHAQLPAKPPTIGFLSPASAASIAPYLDGFRRGLSAAGFAEGRNVVIEYRFTDNELDRLPALAAELVARPVAVIVTGAPPPQRSLPRLRPRPFPSFSLSAPIP
jgi:putative ABC transport system substrate-binding protein